LTRTTPGSDQPADGHGDHSCIGQHGNQEQQPVPHQHRLGKQENPDATIEKVKGLIPSTGIVRPDSRQIVLRSQMKGRRNSQFQRRCA
jgi:hypothetical protein